MSKIPVDLPPDLYPQPVARRKQGSSNVLLFALSFVATFALVWLLLEIF
ncbi:MULTISPECIES: hypothetical protein [Brevundimonas]|jgi:hypothetical protein|uniref:Uncharacterized protein n=1 Tax=Brevundimonas terrae TaxID=363631 RepID=A0ABP3HTQ4_9CAUL|nr:hypothetical protein [Brevundimonas terrae]NIJ27536.1 hypothetical protein [Brevundimonas terrae]